MTLADRLLLKLLSPAYLAIRVLDRAVVKVRGQLPDPALRTPLQVSPVLAATVTLPVGPAPPPLTPKLTVTACLTRDGLGECEVMAVVLLALTTLSVTVPVAVEKSVVSFGVNVTARVWFPASSTVPAAGEYTEVPGGVISPGSTALAFSCVPLSGVP